jgi:orotidine-5'-phosphate decarboxylase
MTRALRAKDRLIVALDHTGLPEALRMAGALRGLARTVKVGSALFTASGPEAVRRLRALGFDVMLDLKFFDIPSTVELSCRSAAALRVSLVTVHAAGGREMLEAAVRGARARAVRPRVLAVTVLTSVASRGASRLVVDRARMAWRAGCDGVVASVHEAPALRRALKDLTIVCPGIRPSHTGASKPGDDQRRVATPAEALASGADLLVVGRPITGSRRPRAAAQAIVDEMEDGGC